MCIHHHFSVLLCFQSNLIFVLLIKLGELIQTQNERKEILYEPSMHKDYYSN